MLVFHQGFGVASGAKSATLLEGFFVKTFRSWPSLCPCGASLASTLNSKTSLGFSKNATTFRNSWRDVSRPKENIQKRSHVPRSSKYMLKFGLFWVGFWGPNTSSNGVWMYRGTESGVKFFEAKMLRSLQIFV